LMVYRKNTATQCLGLHMSFVTLFRRRALFTRDPPFSSDLPKFSISIITHLWRHCDLSDVLDFLFIGSAPLCSTFCAVAIGFPIHFPSLHRRYRMIPENPLVSYSSRFFPFPHFHFFLHSSSDTVPFSCRSFIGTPIPFS